MTLTFLTTWVGLYPFHSDNGTNLYISDDVRGTLRFGYTYPELVDWNVSAVDLKTSVTSAINALYNPYSPANLQPQSVKLVARDVDISSAFSHITFDVAKYLGVNNLATQWSIHLHLERFAYDTTFTIDFFMGTPPADSSLWGTAPNLIGSHAQFIATNVSLTHPNGGIERLLLGEISMTHTLAAGVARGMIDDLSPESVLPLLRNNLHWRARTPDNCEIDLDSLAGLSISVASRNITPTTDLCKFPTYGEFQWHPDATRHKRAGAQN